MHVAVVNKLLWTLGHGSGRPVLGHREETVGLRLGLRRRRVDASSGLVKVALSCCHWFKRLQVDLIPLFVTKDPRNPLFRYLISLILLVESDSRLTRPEKVVLIPSDELSLEHASRLGLSQYLRLFKL